MACCNNPGATMVFGHPMPSLLSDLEPYKSEIESGLVYVDVLVRKSPNGPLESIKCQIQRHVADGFKAAIDEIKEHPEIAFIWGGSYCFRGMNNGKPNPPASIHSLGLAFDVNVAYNPYVRDSYPDDGYRMRTNNHPIVKAFTSRGWVWGGNWSTPDYMHFEFSSGGGSISNGDDYNSVNSIGSDFYSPAFNSASSGYGSSNMSSSLPPNSINRLASTGERDDVLLQDEKRKGDFESLRNRMLKDAPNMGRDVITSNEFYDSSILKQSQSAKEIRD